MNSAVLTLNAGSSSVKFALFAADPLAERFRGQIDAGGGEPVVSISRPDGSLLQHETLPKGSNTVTVRAALDYLCKWLTVQPTQDVQISAIGHRIVHGGPHIDAPCVIDARLLEVLGQYCPLAPLHQPHNLNGVTAAQRLFPQAVQVACFDTAFHRSRSREYDSFAIPRHYYDQGVRRYGFHGLSYEYVIGRLRELAPELADGKVVIAHLGNGASMCALRHGRSVDTTMGFSPLDGLPMGSRCGQIDPGVLLYLLQEQSLSSSELTELLYKESGLIGLSGISSDMRVLNGSADPRARDAIDYFVIRIRRELGALAAILGGLDALVFCAGIGENDVQLRARVLRDCEWLGIEMDPVRNAANHQLINTDRSRCKVYVIKTDEERMLALHTLQVFRDLRPPQL